MCDALHHLYKPTPVVSLVPHPGVVGLVSLQGLLGFSFPFYPFFPYDQQYHYGASKGPGQREGRRWRRRRRKVDSKLTQ